MGSHSQIVITTCNLASRRQKQNKTVYEGMNFIMTEEHKKCKQSMINHNAIRNEFPTMLKALLVTVNSARKVATTIPNPTRS